MRREKRKGSIETAEEEELPLFLSPSPLRPLKSPLTLKEVSVLMQLKALRLNTLHACLLGFFYQGKKEITTTTFIISSAPFLYE